MSGQEPEFLPVVIAIDCEPDQRVTPGFGPPAWDGMEGIIEMIAAWREQVPGAHVGWYWRADAQVARGHGDPAWALRAWRAHIDETTDAGDDHGLHPHLWRWGENEPAWVSDGADPDWAVHCVRSSAEAYVAALGRRPRSMRMGDGHMGPRILAAMEAAGIQCDLTLEPGADATPGLVPAERATGLIPDRRSTPRRPFHPSRLDAVRPGPEESASAVWALPLTTASAGLAGIVPGTAANLGLPPARFRQIVASGLAASMHQGATYLAIVARSDVGQDLQLARRTVENLNWLARGGAGIAPPRFVTPFEALAHLDATAS